MQPLVPPSVRLSPGRPSFFWDLRSRLHTSGRKCAVPRSSPRLVFSGLSRCCITAELGPDKMTVLGTHRTWRSPASDSTTQLLPPLHWCNLLPPLRHPSSSEPADTPFCKPISGYLALSHSGSSLGRNHRPFHLRQQPSGSEGGGGQSSDIR